MSLNPMGTGSYNWNCTNPEKPNFDLELVGTVVAIQEVQHRKWSANGPRVPEFWPDGNPKMDIRMAFALADGSLRTFTFSKAGNEQKARRKPSVHMQMWDVSGGNIEGLVGKTLHLQTWLANPNNGQAWGLGNPRLFLIEEATGCGPFELSFPLPHELTVPELLADTAVSGGAMVQPQPMQPQNIQQPQVPPMPYGYQPTMQQQPMQQQPMPQPQQYPFSQQYPAQYQQPQQFQQPMYQSPQPVYQPPQPAVPTVQQMPPMQPTAQMPQGMDPAVAQAMQAVGAQNVQPVAGYDDEVPF